MSELNPHDDTAGSEPQQSSYCGKKDTSEQGTCTRPKDRNEGLTTAPTPNPGTKSATCLCGAFQIWFSPNIIKSFICHCHNCRKETSSMFATSLLVPGDDDFKITRPLPAANPTHEVRRTSDYTPNIIRAFKMEAESGNSMTSHFCGHCGSTMYRTSSGFPSVMLIPQGVIDDEDLRDRKLDVEQWTCRRVEYFGGLPFTEKFVRNWNPHGEEKKEEVLERVGEGVQAKRGDR